MPTSRSRHAEALLGYPGLIFPDDAAFQNRGGWREFFAGRVGKNFDGKLVFEIGCFDAAYLTEIAAANPRTAFVGLDWKCRPLLNGAQRITELGIKNVVLLRARAQDVARIFGQGEADEIWLFHPDPCDRPVELKNRLFAEPFLKDAHGVLRNDGLLALKTDHPGYYQWALALLGLPQPAWFTPETAKMPGTPRTWFGDLMKPSDLPAETPALQQWYEITANSTDYWRDEAVQARTAGRAYHGRATLFESRFLKKRLPIYFLELLKR